MHHNLFQLGFGNIYVTLDASNAFIFYRNSLCMQLYPLHSDVMAANYSCNVDSGPMQMYTSLALPVWL